jgi:phosphate transport system substrate-binding protein
MKTMCIIGITILCIILSNIEKASAQTDNSVKLSGAGASFPAPLIAAMADHYLVATNGRVEVSYQSIGSGGGIRQFVETKIMFGMSEAYLSDEVISNIENSTGGKGFNMPITLADVVPTYNISGVRDGLIFSPDLLVDLFMGKITNWNNPRIKALNPDVNLPSLPVTIVYRSDGSGTTNIWTSYLTAVSEEWKDKVGYSTSVNWPVGVGGKGNEGVAEVVMNTSGAIGYNSLAYALLNNMAYGSVINMSGNIIEPSFAATTEAANIDLLNDTRVLFTNTPAKNGYPIAGFTWMLVYEHLDKNNAISNRIEAEELIRFLIWCITEGQELSEMLGYARLPNAAIDRNMQMIKQMKWKGELIGNDITNER